MSGHTQRPDGTWAKQPHYAGSYKRRAAALRRMAYLDVTTTCRRCGLTLEARRATHPHETWQAGHLVDGEVGGALVAEHASCNQAAGARARAKRYTGYDW